MNRTDSHTSVKSTKKTLAGPHFSVPASDVTAASSQVLASEKADPSIPLLSTTGLEKSFRKGQVSIPVLRGVDFRAYEGQLTAIVGQSGSGKSTLLHLLATLDDPDAGEIFFEGNRIDNISAKGRDTLRNQYLGMIFQFYHLLPELTTLENVLVPAMIRHGVFKYWAQKKKLRKEAKQLLDVVGLSHRLRHRTRELSGGEMQRVAIARALISKPRVLLADEPTGNLDEQTGMNVMRLLKSLNQEFKLTIVMVTHDTTIAKQADRVVQIVDGRINEL